MSIELKNAHRKTPIVYFTRLVQQAMSLIENRGYIVHKDSNDALLFVVPTSNIVVCVVFDRYVDHNDETTISFGCLQYDVIMPEEERGEITIRPDSLSIGYCYGKIVRISSESDLNKFLLTLDDLIDKGIRDVLQTAKQEDYRTGKFVGSCIGFVYDDVVSANKAIEKYVKRWDRNTNDTQS